MNNEVKSLFASEADAGRKALLAGLAEAYLRRSEGNGIDQIDAVTLERQISALADFVDSRRTPEAAVRVRPSDPTLDGADASGAIVEVNADDAPFLVESVLAEIKEHDLVPRTVLHPLIGTVRAADGALRAVVPPREATRLESVQHYELDRAISAEEQQELESGLQKVLQDLQLAVRDFDAMKARIVRMVEVAERGASNYPRDEVDQGTALLGWLLDDNFVFLGYREYDVVDLDGQRALVAVPGSGLGIMSDVAGSRFAAPMLIDELPVDQQERYLTGHLLVITKTNRLSTVHRRARMDYIGVRHLDPDGKLAGEARLIGLFTAKAYMAASSSIPVLRRKLEWIVDREELIEGSHDHRAAVQIFDSFPKEELFSVPQEELARSIHDLLAIQENERVRLFVRSDLLGRNVSVMVALPRDRFNVQLRRRLQELFLKRFGGTSIDYRLSLGQSDPARIHFTVWVGDEVPEVSFSALEAEVVALARSWEDRLTDRLVARYGPGDGTRMADQWARRFPEYYQTSNPLDIAVGDVAALNRLVDGDSPLVVGLQNEAEGAEGLTRLSFYHRKEKLALSGMMPILEHLGLQIIEEVPTRLPGDPDILIHDFGVLDAAGNPLDLEECGDRIEQLVTAAWFGVAESDSLNRLVVTAGIDHSGVALLRAYRTYWRRVDPHFTVRYVNDTLAAHPSIAHGLVGLFTARFDPVGRDDEAEVIRKLLVAAIDAVESLDEDRILGGFVSLMLATVRTNAYRAGRESLTLKFRSSDVPGMPHPQPLFEIFVYAPEVEGIHLRGGSVARGGLRWSDRREDYRVEVLGLMKAQMTKNAVIVPTGAKGGFVVRTPLGEDPRATVRRAYEVFVRGLLDVSDNLVDGVTVHPDAVRVHDDDDPYLVVAADKGTAAMSDVANALAAEYDFWLGDAFASGGSAGYDHKALGITARGAWESVRHHFHELGIDVDTESVTAVGVGDMSGDVFGNGMLLSRPLKLVAAFDHRHIFIDPNPEPAASFAERRRLFDTPRSSWDDYDRAVLSLGGAVFSRSAKRIELSEEARTALGIDEAELTPNKVIQAILTASVDLLWSGGIGTYIKAAGETDAEVGDRANDAVRVDGRTLRCRVVGEGANLGSTQLGRIEYASGGGRIYADFIDNSGGVHCSDREVNLKILLDLAIARGELSSGERDRLIESLATDVTERIVYDNFLQAQILTQDQRASASRLEAYEDLMQTLEEIGMLKRHIEHLPSSDVMFERGRNGEGMASPELAVLLAYAKRLLKDQLLISELPSAPTFSDDLQTYFPAAVVERFGYLLPDHPLKRELVATIVANRVINSEGITFVSRLVAETGVDAPSIVRAYRIARNVTGAGDRWASIEALEGVVPPVVQHEMMTAVDDLVEATTRWYLARGELEVDADDLEATRDAFARLAERLPEIGPEDWSVQRRKKADELAAVGVPRDLAAQHAYDSAMVYAPDVVEVAQCHGLDLEAAAQLSFTVAEAFQLGVVGRRIGDLALRDRWQRAAARTVSDDVLRVRRRLTDLVIDETGGRDPAADVERYVEAHQREYERVVRLMRAVAQDGGDDVAALVVAVRRMEGLIG